MSTCANCGGLIMEPNVNYGWAGKVCYCGAIQPQSQTQFQLDQKVIEQLRTELAASQRREDTAKRTVSDQAMIIRTLRARLAECFRLSGADPDGNEDWRLAERAVDAVKELRKDYDEACEEMHGKNGYAKRLAAAESECQRYIRLADDDYTKPSAREPFRMAASRILAVLSANGEAAG